MRARACDGARANCIEMIRMPAKLRTAGVMLQNLFQSSFLQPTPSPGSSPTSHSPSFHADFRARLYECAPLVHLLLDSARMCLYMRRKEKASELILITFARHEPG